MSWRDKIRPQVTGRLPQAEGAASDRIGRMAADDLPTASPLDLTGMVLVTCCVPARFGLPDLMAEAATLGPVAPVAVRFRTPFAVLDGRVEDRAYLLAPDALREFRRLVDGTVFVLADGRLRAFLHAVVVAAPGAPTTGAVEVLWKLTRTADLVNRLQGPDTPLELPLAPAPPAVLLWTVGLEAENGRGIRLQSGFVATLDRS